MQKILNKTIMLTIPLSITLTSFAHANPSQEAQAFAAQFNWSLRQLDVKKYLFTW